jgi:hypothetical protein
MGKHDLSDFTFNNSYFLKRGRSLFGSKGLFDEFAEDVKDKYNSRLFSDNEYGEILASVKHDLSRGVLTFPEDELFSITPIRESKIIKWVRDHGINGGDLQTLYIIYMLDYAMFINPKLFERRLIGGSSRRSRMKTKKTRKPSRTRRNRCFK